MQIGTGMQNKILEAMAMSLPCITSNLANNSIGATDGKDVLIAEKPEQYAELIISLLNDKQKAKSIAASGNAFVRENYNWEIQTKKLEELFLKS
jgi:glycosyltransferase involved in cell wall biosynthesis